MFETIFSELGIAPAKKTTNDALENKHRQYKLILFNDDVNTFDYVIECLVAYCKHDAIQAEQCANIVHFKGKCDVKSGDRSSLLPIHKILSNKGLTVEIQ